MAIPPPVTFLIGGVQKGGTTALFEYLRRHPNLEMANCKEVHFFDREADIDWSSPDYDIYHAYFDSFDGRVCGEATPIYIYWPDCLSRIRSYNPDMKMIFLFRDPIGRAYSHWAMEMRRGYEDQPFSWVIRQGRDRVDDPIVKGYHRVYSYVERGFYAQQLEKAYKLFPKSQILNINSEDLSNHPENILNTVCEFLGVPQFPEKQNPLRANVGSGTGSLSQISEVDRSYLRDLYAEDQRRFSTMTGLNFIGEDH